MFKGIYFVRSEGMKEENILVAGFSFYGIFKGVALLYSGFFVELYFSEMCRSMFAVMWLCKVPRSWSI